MRATTPPFHPTHTKEERERILKDFILAGLDEQAAGRVDAIAVLALSPESPVVLALLSLSDELAARRAGATIILAGAATANEDETWRLSFCADFVHEIRLTTSPRVLDGHEQLVVGDKAIWYGDTMRRDPAKRDAFASFMPEAPTAARQGRATYARLWQSAAPIYSNPALSSLVVSTETSDLGECGTVEGSALGDGAPNGRTPTVAETLEVWRPSTRH